MVRIALGCDLDNEFSLTGMHARSTAQGGPRHHAQVRNEQATRLRARQSERLIDAPVAVRRQRPVQAFMEQRTSVVVFFGRRRRHGDDPFDNLHLAPLRSVRLFPAPDDLVPSRAPRGPGLGGECAHGGLQSVVTDPSMPNGTGGGPPIPFTRTRKVQVRRYVPAPPAWSRTPCPAPRCRTSPPPTAARTRSVRGCRCGGSAGAGPA